jgi:hypothetical protein
MPVRKPRNAEAAAKTSERLWKIQSRIYVLWVLGIAVGALQLKPTSFNVIGATFTLEKPELIEGLLFVGCLSYYIVSLFYIVLAPYTPSEIGSFRKAIWFGARRGNTLRGLSKFDLWRLKIDARIMYRMSHWIAVIGRFLPLVHILIYRREPLGSALKAIFS